MLLNTKNIARSAAQLITVTPSHRVRADGDGDPVQNNTDYTVSRITAHIAIALNEQLATDTVP
eukprot:14445-Heterococcus_DN1.PRE.5